MSPPFSYYGGKQRMTPNIIPYIPKHTVYAEPFCGAATLLFRKPYPKITNSDDYREVINDKNELIINFFRVLQDTVLAEKLINKLELTLYSEAEHALAKEICKSKSDDKVLLAWAFFVNISQSFSNNLNSGWGRSVSGGDQAKTFSEKCLNLQKYVTRIRDVNISCCDALKFIKDWDSPQTFFYIDPPYVNTNQGHYAGYSMLNFMQLIDTLKKIKGSMILSSYDVFEKSIPKEWQRYEFKAYSSASSVRGSTESRGERIEVIWVKKASEPRPEIKKLYDSGVYDCFTGDKYL